MGHAQLTVETGAEDPGYRAMIEAEKRWLRANPGRPRHRAAAGGGGGRSQRLRADFGSRAGFAFLGGRHGHRHRGGEAGGDFRGLRAGRRLDHADLRRHRAGPGHRLAARAANGRTPRGRERRGRADDLPFHRAARLSRTKLLEQLGGDEALLLRLIALFQEKTPRLLDDIRSSIARRGSGDLARAAHALLGSLGAFGANDARRLTQQLEAQAHAENYEHTDRTFADLERETAEVHAALAAFTPA